MALEKKEDTYVFSGDAVSEKGTIFSYQGTLSADGLTFSIPESKVPGNDFTAWPVHYIVPQFGRITESLGGLPVKRNCWDYHSTQLICDFDEEASRYSSLLLSLLEEPLQRLVTSVLKEVRLEPDGNVLIQYASLPEEADLVNDFILGDANFMDRSDE
ncbi:MAG: DUF4925 domain-containing protein [Bacteroides sp.]|nr:DUF4925 domain-containing protein [Bacteroides sp.]